MSMPLVTRFVRCSSGESLPESAVVGGRDIDGDTIYVGRAEHNGYYIPCKIIPSKHVAYVAFGGEEHSKHVYEVLCSGKFQWEFSSNGVIPEHAVPISTSEEGETLYAGRVLHKGAQTVGKVQPSHGCLYIPFDGEELSFRDYEVLVWK